MDIEIRYTCQSTCAGDDNALVVNPIFAFIFIFFFSLLFSLFVIGEIHFVWLLIQIDYGNFEIILNSMFLLFKTFNKHAYIYRIHLDEFQTANESDNQLEVPTQIPELPISSKTSVFSPVIRFSLVI